MEVIARIRYRHRGVEAVVESMEDGMVRVRFKKREKSITPGQAVVFYKGDEIIGGGWIERKLEIGG